jgi:hypothetical protein
MKNKLVLVAELIVFLLGGTHTLLAQTPSNEKPPSSGIQKENVIPESFKGKWQIDKYLRPLTEVENERLLRHFVLDYPGYETPDMKQHVIIIRDPNEVSYSKMDRDHLMVETKYSALPILRYAHLVNEDLYFLVDFRAISAPTSELWLISKDESRYVLKKCERYKRLWRSVKDFVNEIDANKDKCYPVAEVSKTKVMSFMTTCPRNPHTAANSLSRPVFTRLKCADSRRRAPRTAVLFDLEAGAEESEHEQRHGRPRKPRNCSAQGIAPVCGLSVGS